MDQHHTSHAEQYADQNDFQQMSPQRSRIRSSAHWGITFVAHHLVAHERSCADATEVEVSYINRDAARQVAYRLDI
jgi:hypothetical protein